MGMGNFLKLCVTVSAINAGMEDVDKQAKKWPQFLAASCICIGAAGNGSVIAWTSNITSDLQDGKLNNIKMSREDMSWAGSIIGIGAFLMCFITAIISDWIGRKLTVLATSVPFIAGWVLILFSQNLVMILAGRFLTGMANGAFCITAPLYTSEIAQTEIRGMLGTFFQLFITIGILYSNVFGKVAAMKLFIILCLALPVAFTVIFIFMPETPVYLVKKEKHEKAFKSMSRLRGKKYDASEELKDIQSAIDVQKANTESLFKLMKTKQATKATLICFSLMFYQQLSGINAVTFYSQDIFEAAGSTLDPKLSTIIIGTVQVFATAFASYTIEKLGRKILLIASDVGMAVGSFILALYFLLKNREIVTEDTLKSIGFLPVMALVIFIIAFSIGFGPIPWLASSEIFPPVLMAKLASFACAFNWFWAFMVAKYYVTVAGLLGTDVTFFIFAGMSFSGMFFVWFVMPETKNRTLDEIQAELAK